MLGKRFCFEEKDTLHDRDQRPRTWDFEVDKVVSIVGVLCWI